jgi:hypothetical protein
MYIVLYIYIYYMLRNGISFNDYPYMFNGDLRILRETFDWDGERYNNTSISQMYMFKTIANDSRYFDKGWKH